MKNPKDFLLYLGCPGCGKSHFCHAIYNDIKLNGELRYKRLWSESEFTSKIKKSFDMEGSAEEAINYICDDHFILLDDMGSTLDSPWKKDILFKFIDNRYQTRLPTIVTSNLNENDIFIKLGERIHSRLFDKQNILLDFGKVDWRRVKEEENEKN